MTPTTPLCLPLGVGGQGRGQGRSHSRSRQGLKARKQTGPSALEPTASFPEPSGRSSGPLPVAWDTDPGQSLTQASLPLPGSQAFSLSLSLAEGTPGNLTLLPSGWAFQLSTQATTNSWLILPERRCRLPQGSADFSSAPGWEASCNSALFLQSPP